MNDKKSIMSDKSKNIITNELGIKNKEENVDRGEISSKDCGKIVSKVIDNVLNNKSK